MRISDQASRSANRTKAVWAMMIAVMVMLIAAGGWFGRSDSNSTAFAQNPIPAGIPAGEHLITLALPQVQTPQGPSHQGIVVIDPVERVLCVYHVDLFSGSVKLQSVRRIHWDLKMSEYNGQQPLPAEIRALVEHQ